MTRLSRRKRLFLPQSQEPHTIEPTLWPQPGPLLPPPSGTWHNNATGTRYFGGSFALPPPRNALGGGQTLHIGWADSPIWFPMIAFKDIEMRSLITPPAVPVVKARDGVIRAQKRGNLPDLGSLPFTGLFVDVDYGVQATAVCAGGGAAASYHQWCTAPADAGRHAAPHPDCSCGFHAHLHGPQECCTGPGWLFDVELYGKVIEHETGYRAQYQRVLSVTPSNLCGLCQKSPSVVFVGKYGRIKAACATCAAIPVFSYSLAGHVAYHPPLSREQIAARIVPAVLNDFAAI